LSELLFVNASLFLLAKEDISQRVRILSPCHEYRIQSYKRNVMIKMTKFILNPLMVHNFNLDKSAHLVRFYLRKYTKRSLRIFILFFKTNFFI